MKKTITIIAAIALMFSLFTLAVGATNRGDQSAIHEQQGIAFYEMSMSSQGEYTDLYSIPFTALLGNYGQTINNNLSGAGTEQIRTSQRVTTPRNDLRHWRTEVTHRYMENPIDLIEFKVADFVYNVNRYEELANYHPKIYGTGFEYDRIEITAVFTVTGYVVDKWEKLTISKTTTTIGQTAELFPQEAIDTAVTERFFNDECIISEMSIVVRFKNYNKNTGNVDYVNIGAFTYETYTDTEQESVSYFLTKYNRPNELDTGTNFWDWLSNSTDSLLNIKIYHEFSIAHLLYCVLGIAIVLIFIKIFAGG